MSLCGCLLVPDRLHSRRSRLDFSGRSQKTPVISFRVGNLLDFATRLRLIRILLNLRQDAMAELLGVKPDTISAWETGIRIPRPPTQRMVTIFAEREGLIFTPKGYPQYADRPGSNPPPDQR